MPLVIFELMLLIGMVLTLRFGNNWFPGFLAAQTAYAIINTNIRGPALHLGMLDALLSICLSTTSAFGAALVLMRAGITNGNDKTGCLYVRLSNRSERRQTQ